MYVLHMTYRNFLYIGCCFCLTLFLIFSERNGLIIERGMLMNHGWLMTYTPLNRAGNAFCMSKKSTQYIVEQLWFDNVHLHNVSLLLGMVYTLTAVHVLVHIQVISEHH